MKLKGLILFLGIDILAVMIIAHFNLSTIDFMLWVIAIICISIGTTWED